jgi:hypothetical protein
MRWQRCDLIAANSIIPISAFARSSSIEMLDEDALRVVHLEHSADKYSAEFPAA